MRVLITGSDGYLGAPVVAALRASGHEAQGLDSGLFRPCLLGPAPDRPPTHEVDLRDITLEHLEDMDAVVHLAALSNDPLGDLEPQITHDINHLAAVRLAELAKQAGVSRFAYSSTCSVYGAAGGDGLVTEDAPLNPVTPYAVSKVLVENDLHALGDDGFTTVSLRNATAYGATPRLRADIVVNDLVARAMLTGEVRVLSDGTPWRPLVHAEDIAAAFVAVLEAPAEAVQGQSFNVGRDGENYRVSEVADIVAAAVPGCEVVITGENGADPRSYRVDFSRITAAVPAFQPRWTVPAGVAQLVEAYTAHGLTLEDSRHRFVRLRWLASLQAEGRLSDDMRWT